MAAVLLAGTVVLTGCENIFGGGYTEFNPDSSVTLDFFETAVRAAFGESSGNASQNWVKPDYEAGTVELFARNETNSAGKIKDSSDGISFFFREVPADRNFRLSATVEVISFGGWRDGDPNFITSNGQEGFGLMARDWVPFYQTRGGVSTDDEFDMDKLFQVREYQEGEVAAGDGSYYLAALDPPGRSNMVFSGGVKRGVRYGWRTGVTGQPEVVTDFAEQANSSNAEFTYFPAELDDYSEWENMEDRPDFPLIGGKYRYTLEKTNSGFRVSVVPPAEKGEAWEDFIWEPDLLTNINKDSFYVGFFAARAAHIKVSDVNYSESDTEQDALREFPDAEIIHPDFSIDSPSTFASTTGTGYRLRATANVPGYLSVRLNGREVRGSEDSELIESDWLINDGPNVRRPAHFSVQTVFRDSSGSWQNALREGENIFQVIFYPAETYPGRDDLLIGNTEPIKKTFSVDRSWFGDVNTPLYVSPNGRGNGLGTRANPLDIDTAIAYVLPGQTITMLDGVYKLRAFRIPRYNNGVPAARKRIVAENNGKVILDFSDFDPSVDSINSAAVIAGNYWDFIGIDVKNAPDKIKGFQVMGSYNLVEWVRTYNNGDTGLQISGLSTLPRAMWPEGNTIRYAESFNNMDAAQTDADGFGAKLTVGPVTPTGGIINDPTRFNRFEWCIAHNNADDGWDLYAKGETGNIGIIVIENSIAYRNGIMLDGSTARAGRNGFKLGGEGIRIPHITRNSVAFQNGAHGFTSNSNPGIILENITSFDNGGFYNRISGSDSRNLTIYGSDTITAQVTGALSLYTPDNAQNRGSDGFTLSAVSNGYLWNGSATVNRNGSVLTTDAVKSVLPPLYSDMERTQKIADSEVLTSEGFIAFVEDVDGGWKFDLGDFLVLEDSVRNALLPAEQTAGIGAWFD